jgi:uncharacterized glyoxalase superfamily protein PhnB
MSISRSHFIVYVGDQAEAVAFYRRVLDTEPVLDVPGMSEFSLGARTVLGLMPAPAAVRLLGRDLAPEGAPRAELYLLVNDPSAYHSRALATGAEEISCLSKRDWGHEAAYSIDPWGNVLAFAKVPP